MPYSVAALLRVGPASSRQGATRRRIAFLGALLLGCSASSSEPTAAEVQRNLDVNFGGYDDKREEPNFGDDAVAKLPRFDATFASHADLAGSSSAVNAYRVALLWGHFPGANDDNDGDTDAKPASWAGSIAVDSGAIDVVRTLSFDEGDSVDARTDAKSVSFSSHTLPFVDGMIVRVQIPTDGVAKLHFTTSELTTDVDLDDVAKTAGKVFHVDGDQGLAVVGWNDTAATCPSGVAYGRFVKLGAAVGTLRGRLASASGDDLGVVRGIWGHAKGRDADVFFAKSIDPAGNFGNLALGMYKTGSITGAQGDVDAQHGKLVGIYSDGYDRPDGRGVFVAKWTSVCSPM